MQSGLFHNYAPNREDNSNNIIAFGLQCSILTFVTYNCLCYFLNSNSNNEISDFFLNSSSCVIRMLCGLFRKLRLKWINYIYGWVINLGILVHFLNNVCKYSPIIFTISTFYREIILNKYANNYHISRSGCYVTYVLILSTK